MPIYPVSSPLVIVHNYLETFREFLVRDGDDSTLMARRFNGDQAVFWQGGSKLVISSAPIHNLDLLTSRWGYVDVIALAPDSPSTQLSLDILDQKNLLDAISDHAGDQGAITLISYAASAELFQLVEYLETELNIRVSTPEMPAREMLWLKHYIDSKIGFRMMVQKWIGDSCLPEGYVATTLGEILEISRYFARAGKGVAIKANIGGSGVGNLFLTASEILDQNFENVFSDNLAIARGGVYVVEEFIPAEGGISPSLEFFVPEVGNGPPVLTYVCNQHFESSGRFAGVIIAPEYYQAPWYDEFKQVGKRIASELQKIGYVGHFDIDAIVDKDGNINLVEINSRRTGGTFVHEFLIKQFGQDYSSQSAFLSQNKISTKFNTVNELEEQIGDLLFPINGRNSGVIILLTSTLAKGNFGYLIVGESVGDVIEMREVLIRRL
jgi:hypothetical protein